MATTSQTFTEEFVEVAGGRVQVRKGGSGAPVLVLHDDTGIPGWLPFHENLAERYTVYAPSHPGWVNSDLPEWARNVRDLGGMYQWLLRALKLDTVSVVGVGFGGWIAAEMATQCRCGFDRLVLVGAMGLLPNEGEIFDQFLVHGIDYVKTAFHDPAKFEALYGAEPDLDRLEFWEINREMTTRIAWKPYMYNRALPVLLPGLDTPTLVVWGREDKIVPLGVGRQYAEAIPNARLEILDGCGHAVDVEKPAELARLVRDFLG
jgi:pimeloyl-ACP methyl ester carboxylesterase